MAGVAAAAGRCAFLVAAGTPSPWPVRRVGRAGCSCGAGRRRPLGARPPGRPTVSRHLAQWVYHWEATPGTHVLRVRATDGAGALQEERRHPPRPDGATGYHRIRVKVTGT